MYPPGWYDKLAHFKRYHYWTGHHWLCVGYSYAGQLDGCKIERVVRNVNAAKGYCSFCLKRYGLFEVLLQGGLTDGAE